MININIMNAGNTFFVINLNYKIKDQIILQKINKIYYNSF
jgi:hypothetical protein